jgi:hypothetical protein
MEDMVDVLDVLFPEDAPLPERDVLHRQYEFDGEYGQRGELTRPSEAEDR